MKVMTNAATSTQSKWVLPLVWVELLVLLMLPLPFLKLNVFYVVLALIIMFLAKFLRKEKMSEYGFKPVQLNLFLIAIGIGIGFGFLDNFLIEPIITKLSGAKPDLSTYASVTGNIPHLLIMLGLGWFIGSLFEEFFFRGYLFNRFGSILKNDTVYKVVTIVLISVVFAFAHTYQGLGGILDTFLFSVVMGILYFSLGKNVWYLIIIHGFYDTVGIFRLYLGY